MPYILALDQGTTSSRAIVFDQNGAYRGHRRSGNSGRSFRSRAGSSTIPRRSGRHRSRVAAEALGRAAPASARHRRHRHHQPARDDGRLGSRDRRADPQRDRLAGPPHRRVLRPTRSATATRRSSANAPASSSTRTFPAPKSRWILDNVPGARGQGRSAASWPSGPIDSWLIWKLTERRRRTSPTSTNASRTMLFNIHTLHGTTSCCKLFDIPASMLPEVRPSSEVYGETSSTSLGVADVPIAGIAGDQQAALFGQMCFAAAWRRTPTAPAASCCMNTGDRAGRVAATGCSPRSPGRSAAQTEYALEGSVFIGGAVVQWLRDGLGIIASRPPTSRAGRDRCRTTAASTSCRRSRGSARRTGIRTRAARSSGITRGTTAGHIARAALESIAFQVADLLDAMQRRLPASTCTELRVDGGAAATTC